MISITFNTISHMQKKVNPLRNNRNQIKTIRLWFLEHASRYQVIPILVFSIQLHNASTSVIYAHMLWDYEFSGVRKKSNQKTFSKTLSSIRKQCFFRCLRAKHHSEGPLKPQASIRNQNVSMLPKETTATTTFENTAFYKKTK